MFCKKICKLSEIGAGKLPASDTTTTTTTTPVNYVRQKLYMTDRKKENLQKHRHKIVDKKNRTFLNKHLEHNLPNVAHKTR